MRTMTTKKAITLSPIQEQDNNKRSPRNVNKHRENTVFLQNHQASKSQSQYDGKVCHAQKAWHIMPHIKWDEMRQREIHKAFLTKAYNHLQQPIKALEVPLEFC